MIDVGTSHHSQKQPSHAHRHTHTLHLTTTLAVRAAPQPKNSPFIWPNWSTALVVVAPLLWHASFTHQSQSGQLHGHTG